MYKQLAKPCKNPVVKAKQVLDQLEKKFSLTKCNQETTLDTYSYTKKLKTLSKQFFTQDTHAIEFLIPFCEKIHIFYRQSNMAPVDSFYLMDSLNNYLLLLIRQQKEAKSIAITTEQFTIINQTIDLCDDPNKWANSPTCKYYNHVSKALLAHIQCQKKSSEDLDILGKTAQTIEFGAKVAQDLTDKNLVGISLDAIELAQKLISLFDYIAIDFDKGNHQFIFNCIMLVETYLNNEETEEKKEQSKKLLLQLADTVNNSTNDLFNTTLAFSIAKLLLNLSSENEKRYIYESILGPLLSKIDSETQFVIYRKLLKWSDYELNTHVQQKLKELHIENHSQTLTKSIAESQSENRFLAEGSTFYHEIVITTLQDSQSDLESIKLVFQNSMYEKDTPTTLPLNYTVSKANSMNSQNLKIPQDKRLLFKPDKFKRTPLILAQQILNTSLDQDKKVKLAFLVETFIKNATQEMLLQEDLLSQNCFDYFAQGNNVTFFELSINKCKSCLNQLFLHEDKNGNKVFHHFADGKVSEDTLKSLKRFCDVYNSYNSLEPLSTYLSSQNKQKDTLLHLFAKALSTSKDDEAYIIDILAFLLSEISINISLNDEYNYFFNYLDKQQLSNLIKKQQRGIDQQLTPFQQVAYQVYVHDESLNLNEFLKEQKKQISSNYEQNLRDLIIYLVSNAPPKLTPIIDSISPDLHHKLIEYSLQMATFSETYDSLAKIEGFSVESRQLSTYLTVDEIKKVLPKCTDSFEYILKIIREFPQHKLFHDTSLDDTLKLIKLKQIVEPTLTRYTPKDIQHQLAICLQTCLDTNQITVFSLMLQLSLCGQTANPNYELDSGSIIKQICKLKDSEKSIQFMRVLFTKSTHHILLSPLSESGDLEQKTPLTYVFEQLNYGLLKMLIKRAYDSLSPDPLKSTSVIEWWKCENETNLIQVKVGMSLTDVARSILSFMPSSYISNLEQAQIKTPSFDSATNKNKLIAIKKMVLELKKPQYVEENSNKEKFIINLCEGVELFFNKKNNMTKMTKNLKLIYKQWQKNLDHSYYTNLKIKFSNKPTWCSLS